MELHSPTAELHVEIHSPDADLQVELHPPDAELQVEPCNHICGQENRELWARLKSSLHFKQPQLRGEPRAMSLDQPF